MWTQPEIPPQISANQVNLYRPRITVEKFTPEREGGGETQSPSLSLSSHRKCTSTTQTQGPGHAKLALSCSLHILAPPREALTLWRYARIASLGTKSDFRSERSASSLSKEETRVAVSEL